MRAAQLITPGRIEMREVADPPARLPAGAALVRIRKVGVCGSDIHLFRHGRIGELLAKMPMTIGHEAMGVVEAVAGDVDGSLVGRRVAIEPTLSCGRCEYCLGGQPNLCTDYQFVGLPPHPGVTQPLLVHPARLLEPVPDAVSDEQAVLLEPLAVAVWAVDLAGLKVGQSAAVLGTGVLGGLTLMVLRQVGCNPIICTDLLANRLALAGEFGATHTIDAGKADAAAEIARITGGRGVDVTFEACGSAATMEQMVHTTRPGGRCVVIGINDDDRVSFTHGVARRKGLDIRMVRRSRLTLGRAIDLVAGGKLPVDRLVTHRFSLSGAQAAFDLVSHYGDNVIKAMISPQEAG
ncbi:MAG: alcohol dehydrogenase catalytic domain-containing protein [Phycisphaerae bacterium]|nr:alcohol dehydrogenase catalytic domain-containing protein [Phycisphaerae bacterium]